MIQLPGPWEWRPDQARILPTLLASEYYMLVWEMRTGKTWPAYMAMHALTRNRCLIVCPPKVMGVWKDAHEKLLGDDVFDLLSSGKLEPDYVTPMLNNKYDSIIIDEIHQYRYDSIRFRQLRRLTDRADRVFGLTGTPFDADLAEIFRPWQLLDGGKAFGRNEKVFRMKYCAFDESSNGTWEITPDGHDRIMKVVSPHMDRLSPHGLVKPEVVPVPYNLTRQQNEYYVALKAGHPLDFFNGENVEFNKGVVREKQFQVCSGFLLWTEIWEDDGEEITQSHVLEGIPTIKWGVLQRLLAKLDGSGVVWVRYVKEYELAKEACIKAGLVVKKYSPKTLTDLNQGRVDVLLAHPRSAGVGVDMSVASWAVFVSETPSTIDQAQARARLSLLGDTEKKTIYYLLAQESNTEEQHKNVQGKISYLERFVQGGRR